MRQFGFLLVPVFASFLEKSSVPVFPRLFEKGFRAKRFFSQGFLREQKGFFCFSLALVFALSVFALYDSANAIKERASEAKTIAIALEQTSLKRFELELDSDKAIQQAIEQSIKAGRDSTEQIKESADAALFELFQKEKELSKEKIEFYSASNIGKKVAELGFSKKRKALEKKDIEENSKALSIGISGRAYIVEYSMTGGLLKNKLVFALIENTQGKQIFLMPTDYSNKTVVAKYEH